MAAADARQALDDKIMLNPAPQDLDEVQMQDWRDRRQQIADRLRQKNTQDFETVIPNKDRCDETVGEAA
ncbi:uncharacterized protein MELLADRAFT_57602 [Melampsora larici-populina 98AG31]|uniref:Uncharacterized protein n=1 Tax=Melampsora larici-populina (strain 98AG31 / pathotype 3-4-7) TaxID=747676 RepID=F4S4L8_MELLP|nr:uncharacterized protein MELLADRAFT_57602 [Melampsora larici-populina 98AG31]EGG00448.1 hypothetical protein MELLADRAFT_57602 [Melampsora larici-populina 98AG31]